VEVKAAAVKQGLIKCAPRAQPTYSNTLIADDQSEREWIVITFRGSVTSKDFAVDADPFMNWYVMSTR
jgi:hypothetical protein